MHVAICYQHKYAYESKHLFHIEVMIMAQLINYHNSS